MLEQARDAGRRGRRRARPPAGRHARFRARRTGGADLLPVPCAAAPADLGRSPPHLRAGGRSLRPGGRFAWNAFAFDHHIAARLDGTHHERTRPAHDRYAVADNRIDIILDDGGTSSLWWATKNEWLGLIDVAGLELEALYGGFAGEPFDDDSREYVFVVVRR